MSGTSIAGNHVSGVAALMMGENANMTPAQVVGALTGKGTKGNIDDAWWGSPDIMLYAGINSPTPPPTPVPPTPAPTPKPMPPMPANDCGFEFFEFSCNYFYNIPAPGDQFDWTHGLFGGPKRLRGGADGSWGYLFIKTSYWRKTNDKATLMLHPLILSGKDTMEFQYHMNGRNIGTLNVEVGGKTVWNKTGDQGNAWNKASVRIDGSGASQPVVSFTGILGSSDEGDIAIDSIKFSFGTPAPTPAPTPKPMPQSELAQ